jgi:hypothetical protein
MRKRVRHLAAASFGPLLLAGLGCKVPEAVGPHEKAPPTACTQEAKVCTDGTVVTRSGPDCEFADCPDTQTAPPDNGITPDPAPDPPTGSTNPEPMGTFTDPEPPPG